MTLQLGRCRSCDSPVIWVTMVRPDGSKGRRNPLDPKPEKRVVVSKTGKGGKVVDTYVSHFATCPQADDWRGGSEE